MEKTTSHESAEPNVAFEQAVREIEEARTRVEEAKIASRERIALAEIASEERMQHVRLDALFKLARYAFDCLSGRIRPTGIDCTLRVSAYPTPGPAEDGVTEGRMPDVAPASAI